MKGSHIYQESNLLCAGAEGDFTHTISFNPPRISLGSLLSSCFIMYIRDLGLGEVSHLSEVLHLFLLVE